MIKKEDYSHTYNAVKEIKTVPTKEFYKNYVNLEFTEKLCSECPQYNNNWACPKFEEDVTEYWKKYENIELIATKIVFTEEFLEKTYKQEEIMQIVDNTLFKEKSNITDELMEKEKQYNGLALSAGYCDICSKCSRIDNKPCIHPDLVRHSIESIGTLVNETLTGVFGFKLETIDMKEGKFPEYLTLLTAVLY
ncbi:DUF2284 domain-containing protein [Methanosphaera sp.]